MLVCTYIDTYIHAYVHTYHHHRGIITPHPMGGWEHGTRDHICIYMCVRIYICVCVCVRMYVMLCYVCLLYMLCKLCMYVCTYVGM